MLLRAYTVYDNKSLSFSPPFFQQADGAAARMFSDLANDSSTTIGRHPSDYSLFCIGGFDDQKGHLTYFAEHIHIVDAQALVRYQPSLPLEAK